MDTISHSYTHIYSVGLSLDVIFLHPYPAETVNDDHSADVNFWGTFDHGTY